MLARPGAGGSEPPKPFTWENPRLTPDREDRIRRSLKGADMRGTRLPAWMAASLLAEVDALRAEKATALRAPDEVSFARVPGSGGACRPGDHGVVDYVAISQM